MAHFAAVCDPGPSHVMAMTAICSELQRRGHRTTLFAFPGFEDRRLVSGFDVWPNTIQSDYVERRVAWISRSQALRLTDFLEFAIERVTLVCENGPQALRDARVDCVLVDGLDPGAAAVAEKLDLPFITINNALPLNQEASVPPDFLPWYYHDATWAKLRNWTVYRLRDIVIRPLLQALNRYRIAWGLKLQQSPDDSFSPYAQVTQLVPEFDYSRKHLVPWFHYVGPYRREGRDDQDFPYERLDGRPVIYASLGTVQGSRAYLWETITKACADLDAQLVLGLGKCQLPAREQPWPGNPIAVAYAPQREILARASLAILHGGMNSAMEALAAGVPTLVLPVIGDQFGVAARVAYSGTGESVPASHCNAQKLRTVVEKILHTRRYAQRAHELRQAVERTRGVQTAADIITNVVETGSPVLRSTQK